MGFGIGVGIKVTSGIIASCHFDAAGINFEIPRGRAMCQFGGKSFGGCADIKCRQPYDRHDFPKSH